LGGAVKAAERRARIDAYERSFLARLAGDVSRCRRALKEAEQRLADAREQKAKGELMTAALHPSVVRMLQALEPAPRPDPVPLAPSGDEARMLLMWSHPHSEGRAVELLAGSEYW